MATRPAHLRRSLAWDQGSELAQHAQLTIDADLARHNVDVLDAIAATLNRRPRKALGWRTPTERLEEFLLSATDTDVATTG